MINIDCERDEQGFYILDSIDKNTHTICQNASQPLKNSENFWFHRNNGSSFLVKYRKYPAYIFALYAELLCEGVFKQNGVRCANVDVGKYNGQYCVLSESVISEYDESFNAHKLASLSGFDPISLLASDEDWSTQDYFYADKLYEFANDIKMAFPEIVIDEDFLLDLYKLSFIDLMCNQKDRNPTNILFGLKDFGETTTLSVAPVIDNEYSFEFLRLLTLYNHYKIDPNLRNLKNENHKRVFDAMNQEFMRASKYSTPIFGTKDVVDLFRIPASLNCEDEKYKLHTALASSIIEDEYTNMAIAICKNPKLREFYEGFSVDMFAIGENIKNQSGFEIPTEYLEMTQKICEANYKRMKSFVKSIDKKIAKMQSNKQEMER